MRELARFLPRALVLTAALAAAAYAAGHGRAAAGPAQEAPEDAAPASCANECRGLGLRKVQAGEEHCGLVPREIKDDALDAACRLAEANRQKLEALAEERAREKCAGEIDQPACTCRTELRPWQNVYTHVLSKNCWTECGWAFLIDCDRRPEAGDS